MSKRHTGTTALVVLAMLAIAAFVAGPAVAQTATCPRPTTYPPRNSDLQLSQTVVERGGSFRAASCGWRPGSAVTVTLESHPILLGTVTADANGRWEATFTIPLHAHLGLHTVVATGQDPDGRPLRETASIRIIDPAPAAAAAAARRGLVVTGVDVLPWAVLAVAVLGIGVVMLRASRRKKGDSPA